MTTGSFSRLPLDPAVRFTLNGASVLPGAVPWTRPPRLEGAHHIFDTQRCGSMTIAVLSDDQGRFILGLRLAENSGLLKEIETHVVREGQPYFNPLGIATEAYGLYSQTVPEQARLSREELIELTTLYLAPQASTTPRPPFAPQCTRRQNGAYADSDCGMSPAPIALQLRYRFPVVDTELGVTAALIDYESYLAIFLVKAAEGQIQQVDGIGRIFSVSGPGW